VKTCNRCLREYDDTISVQKNPADDLGEMFLKATDPERENDLCPDCREEMGIFTLLGFGK
jgi:hypothetical protein